MAVDDPWGLELLRRFLQKLGEGDPVSWGAAIGLVVLAAFGAIALFRYRSGPRP